MVKIQQNLITSGTFQTSVNFLNRLTAPNLELILKNLINPVGGEKNVFWRGRRGPISVTHDKNYPPMMETVVDTVKGRDSGKGAGSRPWSEKVQQGKVCG